MADFNKMLTTEMSDKQYQKWCKNWKKGRTESFVSECGMTKAEAEIHAEMDFEQFIGQGGDEARNENIMWEREKEAQKEEYLDRNCAPFGTNWTTERNQKMPTFLEHCGEWSDIE